MASLLRAVTGDSSSTIKSDSSSTNDLGKRLAKWALIIGVPTAVCVAAYVVYRQQEKSKKSAARRTPPVTESNKAAGDDSIPSDSAPKFSKTRLEIAVDMKNEGNSKYREKKYDEAIDAYTKAIESCPLESTEELSQFYQNRAATWEILKNFNKVIEDCSRAIELNPKYVKCIQRRARAAENVGDFELALEDYSTVCFLDSYQPTYIMAADKVLNELARRYVEKLEPSTAELSSDYVRTSLNEFEDDPTLNKDMIDEIRVSQPDSPLARAYQAFEENRFTDIPSLCSQEINTNAETPYRLHSVLFRGSFYLLMGNYAEAIQDFDRIIKNPKSTESMIVNAKLKRANTKIHQRDFEGAMTDYDQCVATHPTVCSPRVHRGMFKTLMENYTEAQEDFDEALRISPTNLRAKYQKLINDAKIGAKQNRADRVEDALKSFEEYFDTCKKDIYYALALTSCYLDNDRKEKALECLDKFVQEIPNSPTLMALKANCLMTADPSNSDQAETLFSDALKIDPSNETVLTMFAIFKCNKNHFEEASNLYQRAIECSRGEEKLTQYAALFYAIRAQGRAVKRLNLTSPGSLLPGGNGPFPGWMGATA